jgi:hypothetical protein
MEKINARMKQLFPDVSISESGDNIIISIIGYEDAPVAKFNPPWSPDDTFDYLLKVVDKVRIVGKKKDVEKPVIAYGVTGTFQCPDCEFVGKNAQSLRMHKMKKNNK